MLIKVNRGTKYDMCKFCRFSYRKCVKRMVVVGAEEVTLINAVVLGERSHINVKNCSFAIIVTHT